MERNHQSISEMKMETSRNGKRRSTQHVSGWADVIRHQIQRKEVLVNGEEGKKKMSEHRLEGKRMEQEHGMECPYQEHLSYMSDESCRVLK